MQCATILLHCGNNGLQCLVLEERAILDCLGDARKLLIDDAAGADIGMTNLGVAHLSIRQADEFAGSLQLRVRIFFEQAVNDRCLSNSDGIVRILHIPDSPAIHDDEGYRSIL